MALAEGIVGPVTRGEGAPGPISMARTGGQRTNTAHAEYWDTVSRGNTFAVSTTSTGVAPGTAFSTTPPMALWNPPASGKNLSLIVASLGYVSGTLGAGTICYGFVNQQVNAPTGGAELTIVSQTLLSSNRGVGRAWQGSTLVGTPILLRPMAFGGPALATTAVFPAVVKDELRGEIVVPPGAVLVVQGHPLGAGTTPLMMFGLTWEEIPI